MIETQMITSLSENTDIKKEDNKEDNKEDIRKEGTNLKKDNLTDSLIGYEFKNIDVTQIEVKPVKKKRGRKPKPKPLNKKPRVLKKRGRKPKPKSFVKKIPKKRGRKPKKKIQVKIIRKNLNESLIIHLPIKSSQLNINELYKYNPKINEPQPYEPLINKEYSTYNSKSNKKTTYNYNNNNNIIDNIKKNIKISNNIEKNIKEKKDEVIINNINKNKLMNIQYEFINFNKNKKWPQKILSSCLWCCHKFNNIPISLPYKYINNTFHVSGFFCSYNCAASYSFNKKDTKIWERYSLLNLMYKKINKCSFIKIPLAPSKEILKNFGGYMNINEYRENLTFQEKNINIIEQPLISIMTKSEEIINCPNIENNKGKFIPINDKLVAKAKISLRLKRKNSIINKKNTLQSFMDLTISKI
jgi:hypothetical protein